MANIRWDKTISKYVKRKRGVHGQNTKKMQTFIYENLYDGVHPNEELSTKWYSFMLSSVLHDIINITDVYQEEESGEDDTWDFKRIVEFH